MVPALSSFLAVHHRLELTHHPKSRSFVTGFLGMNTTDIRDIDASQTLYWFIAIPITAGVLAAAFLYGYKGDEIEDWVQGRRYLSQARSRRTAWFGTDKSGITGATRGGKGSVATPITTAAAGYHSGLLPPGLTWASRDDETKTATAAQKNEGSVVSGGAWRSVKEAAASRYRGARGRSGMGREEEGVARRETFLSDIV